jgi:hypothetical protein
MQCGLCSAIATMLNLFCMFALCALCCHIIRGIDWHWGSGAVSGTATEYVSMTWQGRLSANYSEVYTFNVITVSATDTSRYIITCK